ncbi:hypothetical protein WMY93_020672 [Mugilogobius chulae]|uniref:Uncharacterized protein n=1 Tax=Mugilogobius chulae TaxID=88201 RepID=A0AAW0NDF3_9GOBI
MCQQFILPVNSSLFVTIESAADEVSTSLSSGHEPLNTQASVTVTGLDSLEVSSTQTKQPVKISPLAPHSQWRLSTAALSSTFCHFTGSQQLKLQRGRTECHRLEVWEGDAHGHAPLPFLGYKGGKGCQRMWVRVEHQLSVPCL